MNRGELRLLRIKLSHVVYGVVKVWEQTKEGVLTSLLCRLTPHTGKPVKTGWDLYLALIHAVNDVAKLSGG